MTTLPRLASDYRRAEARYLERKDALYAAIREAHASGMSLRAIAAKVKLSSARVHMIVREEATNPDEVLAEKAARLLARIDREAARRRELREQIDRAT